jgi:transcriptional regulator with XRE-family HTH domain
MSNMFSDPSSRSSRQAYESKVWAEFFGDLLRSAREQRSLSLEEAGRRAGMTASQWEAIEAGRVPTTLDQLQALAAGLDIEWSAMAGLALLCRQAWGR